MPKWYCCVKDCSAAVAKRTNLEKYPWMLNVGFFPLPCGKNAKLRQKWLNLIRREQDWVPNKYTRICGRHFVGGNGPTAQHILPTLFPHNYWGDSKKPRPVSKWCTRGEQPPQPNSTPELKAECTNMTTQVIEPAEVPLLPPSIVPDCGGCVEIREYHTVYLCLFMVTGEWVFIL